MKIFATSSFGGRGRLLVACSGMALALAAAQPATAAPSVTGDAVYTLDGGASVGDPQGPGAFFDIYPSAYSGTSDIFGHTYGYSNGIFGTRSSGGGEFSINGFSQYVDTYTNNTSAPVGYSLVFLIQGGQVGAVMDNVTGIVFGGVTADIWYQKSTDAAPVQGFHSAASMSITDYGPAVFTQSGTVLGAGGPSLGAGSGDYYWNDYTGRVDFGVLAPGESVSFEYKLTSLAYSTVVGCPSGGSDGGGGGAALMLNAMAVEGPGGGGSGCSAIGRIGDPLDGDVDPRIGDAPVLYATVPEPASMAMLGAGLAGLLFVRRRRNVA